MNTNLVNLSNSLSTNIIDSVAFVRQIAPEVGQEILRYGMFSGVVGVVFAAILFFVCRHFWSKAKADEKDPWESLFIIPAFFALLIGGMIMFFSFTTIFKVTFAPKVYLLQQVRLIAQ